MRNVTFPARPLKVALVGVGGTGSEMLTGLTHLHAALLAQGKGGLMVHAFDPDTVSEANLVRQRYARADLGRNKAEVLTARVNLACGVWWQAHPEAFGWEAGRESWDLVISCVDTRQARAKLHKYAFASGFRRWLWWLDCGNGAAEGQAVLGEPRHPSRAGFRRLPCATELHPDLRDASLPEEDAPSCSALEAVKRQGLFTNRQVATHALQLLYEAFFLGRLRHHAYYFNQTSGQVVGRAVPSRKAPRRLPQAAD